MIHLAQSHRQTAQAGPDPAPPLGGQPACLLGCAAWIVGRVGLLVLASLALLGGLALQEPCAMGMHSQGQGQRPSNDDFLIRPDGIQNAVVSACQQDEAREQMMMGCCCRYKHRYSTSL